MPSKTVRAYRLEPLEPRETPAGLVEVVEDLGVQTGRFLVTESVAVGDLLYYTPDTLFGKELWRTDGTVTGTVTLGDLNPTGGSYPSFLTNVNGTLFFSADDGTSGAELWRVDPGATAAVRVVDLRPGFNGSFPRSLVNVNGVLFFAAADGVSSPSGGELWRSDGTASGTVLVKDLIPGPASSYPAELVVADGVLFFTAQGIGGFEVWRSDGTTAGTVSLTDGTVASYPRDLTAVGDAVFFTAENATGREVWRANAGGFVQVGDFDPGAGDGGATGFTEVDGALFFFTNDTVAGARLWRVAPGAATAVQIGSVEPAGFTAANVGGVLYLAANDAATGVELWRADGTAASLVEDLVPGTDSGSPQNFLNAAGTLYFSAAAGPDSTARELWKSDGTAINTAMVAYIDPTTSGPLPTNPTELVNVGAVVYFERFPGGEELFRSDGTTPGTARLGDIRPSANSSYPNAIVRVGDVVFFAANGGPFGTELWRSDGTATGTFLVRDVNPAGGSYPFPLSVVGGLLYFSADDGATGRELWKTDGTAAGTMRVVDAAPGPASANPGDLVGAGGMVYFTTTPTTSSRELWRVDAASGAVRLLDGSFLAGDLEEFNGRLLFRALSGAVGGQLWTTDGTVGGTVPVTDGSNGMYNPFELTNVGGLLYFRSLDATAGQELWRSDGTALGTVRVSDSVPGLEGSYPADLTNVAGVLYFRAFLGGQDAGYFRIAAPDQPAVSFGTFPKFRNPFGTANFTLYAGSVYFLADDGLLGQELWRVDPGSTAAVRVADILVGGDGSGIAGLVELEGLLYFSATDGF
ncbi:MAG: ELWxxDGT repeat protein, partial [Planctomycetia bacterium]